MHRSGTSILSRVLDKSGIFQGVFKDHNNEAFHFLSMNQQMLKKAGGDWLNPVVPDRKSWYDISPNEIRAEHFQVESQETWKQLIRINKPWGWKDPRNTFTIDRWLDLFPKAKVIHLLRDARAVSLSLKNRNKVEGEVYQPELDNLDFNFKLWEKYVRQGSSIAQKTDRFMELRYEDLGQEETIIALERFTKKKVAPVIKEMLTPLRENKYDDSLNQLAQQSDEFQHWYSN